MARRGAAAVAAEKPAARGKRASAAPPKIVDDKPKILGDKVVVERLDKVRPNTWNVNEMTEHERAATRHGLKSDGWLKSHALLVWGTDERGREKNLIIDGQHRWEEAPKVGFVTAPMVFLHGITEAAARAWTTKLFMRRGAPNEDRLAAEMRELAKLLDVADLGLELGVEQDALARMLAEPAQVNNDDDLDGDTALEVGEALQKKWGTLAGQVWNIPGSKAGVEHRIAIGSSSDAALLARLFGERRIDLIVSSPPYNVGIKYNEYDDAQVKWPDYKAFLTSVLAGWVSRLDRGRFIAWNIGVSPKTHFVKQFIMLEEMGLEFYRQMVWKKAGVPAPIWFNTQKQSTARAFTPNFVHEMVYLFSAGAPKKGATVQIDDLLQHDVFELQSSTSGKDLPRGRGGEGGHNSGLKQGSQAAHPATFPVKLPLAFISNLSDVGAIVADPFMGSGTTMVAAELAGRCGYGVELNPVYAAIALERMSKRGLYPVIDAPAKSK